MIPNALREPDNLTKGDTFTLIDLGGVFILRPKRLKSLPLRARPASSGRRMERVWNPCCRHCGRSKRPVNRDLRILLNTSAIFSAIISISGGCQRNSYASWDTTRIVDGDRSDFYPWGITRDNIGGNVVEYTPVAPKLRPEKQEALPFHSRPVSVQRVVSESVCSYPLFGVPVYPV
jgi:hypothetical protein